MLTEARLLITGTSRVWWQLCPAVTAVFLLGWLTVELVRTAAIILGDVSAWLTLAVFSLSFLAPLVALIVILRMVGAQLDTNALVGSELVAGQRLDEPSLTRVLAVTMLPLLALYAGFGVIADGARQVEADQMVRNGVITDAPSVLGVLNAMSRDHPWRLLLLVVGLYLVRRALDLAHERIGWRLFGLLVTAAEAFFLLLMIMGGSRIVALAVNWLTSRQFMVWLAAPLRPLEWLLAQLAIDLPEVVDQVWAFVLDEVWPVLWEVVSQPIMWLAVAALLYGTSSGSLAELWRRRGRPVTDRLTRPIRRRRAPRPAGLPSGTATLPAGVVRAGNEFRNAFLGDVDDKYVPTLHALRLVATAGAPFLAAFVGVYAIWQIFANSLDRLGLFLVGGHDVSFWIIWGSTYEAVQQLLTEPIRLCLLGVGFHRCMELYTERRSAEVSTGAAAEPAEVSA